MPKAVKTMTIEELEAEQQRLEAERASLQVRQREVAQLLDDKRAVLAAQQRLAAMNDAERRAFAQVLAAEGIPSRAAFGDVEDVEADE